MAVKVSINKNWDTKIGKQLQVGLLEMVVDIHKRSVILAPRDTGALVNSSKISPIPNGYAVTYGNERVPYARRRYYENKLHPGTKYYLGNAADGVTRGDKSKYFRNTI